MSLQGGRLFLMYKHRTSFRSQERLESLNKTEKSRATPVKQVPASKPPTKTDTKKKKLKSFLPDISRRSSANSRSSIDSKNRASIVSRKIATRKAEVLVPRCITNNSICQMRSSKSTSDLTVEQEEIRTRSGRILAKRENIARSEEYLNKRPPWDISPYREGDDRNERTLPPIHHRLPIYFYGKWETFRSNYSLRSVHASPVTKKRLTGSHSTLYTAR